MLEKGFKTRSNMDIFLTKRKDIEQLANNLGIGSEYAVMADLASEENIKTNRSANVFTLDLKSHISDIRRSVVENQFVCDKIMQEYDVLRGEAEEALAGAFEEGHLGNVSFAPV
jgi:hypothetical protein